MSLLQLMLRFSNSFGEVASVAGVSLTEGWFTSLLASPFLSRRSQLRLWCWLVCSEASSAGYGRVEPLQDIRVFRTGICVSTPLEKQFVTSDHHTKQWPNRLQNKKGNSKRWKPPAAQWIVSSGGIVWQCNLYPHVLQRLNAFGGYRNRCLNG